MPTENTATPAGESEVQRPQGSLFGDILDWLLVPLLLVWPLSVVIIWVSATCTSAGAPGASSLTQV